MRFSGRRMRDACGADDIASRGRGSSRADAPQTTPFAEVFAQLAAKLVGGVVNISTTQVTASPMPKGSPEAQLPGSRSAARRVLSRLLRREGCTGAPNPPASRVASLGSGFIIDPSGLIVTNNHVIANAEQIAVTFSDDNDLAGRGRRSRRRK